MNLAVSAGALRSRRTLIALNSAMDGGPVRFLILRDNP
jgi:hypothetical protein